jgi:hypothetical protein
MFLLPSETLASIGVVLAVLWSLTLFGIWRSVRNSKEILKMIRDMDQGDRRVTDLRRSEPYR